MIHAYRIDGVVLRTGDIVCTSSEGEDIQPGQYWRLLGRLVPGVVDHVAVYVGPGGRCVEAGGRGVIAFEVPEEHWVAEQMFAQRGRLVDSFYGAAYPLGGRGLPEMEEERIRLDVAEYCLAQAEAERPYNLNFLNPELETAFYCSQLAYKAYVRHGIDLNTGQGVPNLVGTAKIIFPQEIWSGCKNRRAGWK
jgi:hypothetical protein